ncbi:hypothetical protein FB451DRAFT_1434399 [Mycena latifolia]|nr:hypothetical protein FB451DRAFT_1434399 [Mycena latifolia]
MPRLATTSTSSSSHRKPSGGKTPPCPPLRFRCIKQGCLWSFARKSCLERHLHRHKSPVEKDKLMYKCPEHRCTHKTLQKSNLITHYHAKHAGLKPHICSECSYCAADPSCLYRHMQVVHRTAFGTAPRVRRAAGCTAAFLFTLERAGSPVSSPDSEIASGAWTTFSPTSSDSESLPISPASTDASPPASPPASEDAWTWEPTFEEACSAMGIILPLPVQPPALHCPAESLVGFVPGFDESAMFFMPIDDKPVYPLDSSFAPQPFTPAFISQWGGFVY